ncbi:MAG: radical SAM protein [Deltaproteobacteria bacterium]|nr:MAG: radical SAM protein [Deltaproteobacteria bacterium]
MKILLIYPYFIEERIHVEDITVPPIGIYYVGAVLKENNYEVEILNWHAIHKTPERIEEVLRDKKPDVIGFSILHANRWGGIEIARIAKQLNPEVQIVFGGIGASLLWEHLLRHFPEIDFVVIGEGDYTFLKLMKWVEGGDEPPPKNIKGIAFRENGKVVKTEKADPQPDLDRLPTPAKYFEYQHLSSTRGCAWNCTFCGSPQFWGHKIRFRSPENFVEELEHLYQRGIRFFYISDDTFTTSKKRVIEICKRIIEKNLEITWFAISRVDHVDDEILYWMRKAGCIQISYGVESGSEKIRTVLNKKIRPEQIKKAFALTVQYGIVSRAYFIYGSPGETWDTIQESLDLIHEIKPLSMVVYILDIFPGTQIYADLQKRSHVTDDVWLNRMEGIMYFETDPNLSDELILAFGKKLRKDYYENIHKFVDAIHLVDREDLYVMHADFCSRLAMTFSHGDYSKIDVIRDKDKIAEKLYRKALSYHPNHRAYLGLGIIKQKGRAYKESIEVLLEGIEYFPNSQDLNMCLGLSYMNLRHYDKALEHFLKLPDSKDALYYAATCYKELGDSNKESAYLERCHNLEQV